MKNTTLLAIGALAASVLLAFTMPAAEVRFAPAEGSSITKTFSSESTFTLDDMGMTMNGEAPPMMPEMDMEMTLEGTIQVTDVYASLDDGTVVKLVRTFDSIGQDLSVDVSMDMMGENHDMSQSGAGSSALEGSTVAFTWNEDDEEYARAFEDDAGDEDLLEGLVEDMDMRALLPQDSVSEGDEWDVELITLADILAPGGDLSIDVEMDGQSMMQGPDPQMMTNMREMLADLLDGEFTATYQGTREVDGTKVGVIGMAIDIESARDMSDLMQEGMDETEMPFEVELERADVEFTLEAEGELLWHLEAGHLHSFELNGEASITMDMAMSVPGQGMEMETSMEMSGTMRQTILTESAN